MFSDSPEKALYYKCTPIFSLFYSKGCWKSLQLTFYSKAVIAKLQTLLDKRVWVSAKIGLLQQEISLSWVVKIEKITPLLCFQQAVSPGRVGHQPLVVLVVVLLQLGLLLPSSSTGTSRTSRATSAARRATSPTGVQREPWHSLPYSQTSTTFRYSLNQSTNRRYFSFVTSKTISQLSNL